MIELDDIEREVLTEGLEDYVGAWEFAWLLRHRRAEMSLDAVREAALARIRRLVDDRLVVAGQLLEAGGFEPWSEAPTAVVDRIADEWAALGRDPQIGEICWFSNTHEGDELGRAIQHAQRR